jgi:hypothetical protein
MLELIKSERFRSEYQLYQSKIEKITDPAVQKQATNMLKTLVNEIKKLDNHHQDMFSGGQIPISLGDVRSKITDIRKKIDRLCKDWEQSNTKS